MLGEEITSRGARATASTTSRARSPRSASPTPPPCRRRSGLSQERMESLDPRRRQGPGRARHALRPRRARRGRRLRRRALRAGSVSEPRYTLAEASALIGPLGKLILELREAREVITDRELSAGLRRVRPAATGAARTASASPQAALVFSRGLAQIERWGVVVRDLGTGICDFPARRGDRDVFLCWRRGRGARSSGGTSWTPVSRAGSRSTTRRPDPGRRGRRRQRALGRPRRRPLAQSATSRTHQASVQTTVSQPAAGTKTVLSLISTRGAAAPGDVAELQVGDHRRGDRARARRSRGR